MFNKEKIKNGKTSPRLFRLKYFIIIVLICAIVPFAAVGLNDLYTNILEHNPPEIQLLDKPRGVGLSPVSVRFLVRDYGAGLDEVVVRISQRGDAKEVYRSKLHGKRSEEITIDLDHESHALTEGNLNIDIRAFDRSFWSNRAEMRVPLRVDFRRPKIEALTSQHNAREGGSQLVFYRAFDEDLAVSGVKVGNRLFMGYPATGIDRDLNDNNLRVAFYAIGLDVSRPVYSKLRLFAEDNVGNTASSDFYNRVAARNFRALNVPLAEDFMRVKVVDLANNARGKTRTSELPPTDPAERLLSDFTLVNENLRALNQTELASLVSKNPRHESYWEGPFVRQSVTLQQAFGDTQVFIYEGKEIGRARNIGEEWLLPRNQSEILAVNTGIVVLVQEVGVYGWTVAVDHGLGLVSVYSRLGHALVQKGAVVQKGQAIGVAGRSGFARNQHVHFEIRVQGVPVDPTEWFDASWYYGHVVGKINDIKRMLGIPVYVPLR